MVCFSGKLAKQTFKLARRAFIDENLGLLVKRASSWLSERTWVQASNAREDEPLSERSRNKTC
ncbi:hypothetical protein L195_g039196 [Trifolium pratense]|uniref:Uncharacterized protein n=1 Tax=Trifolium pratense TaxID=57577 RepID=A0A2K3LX95_TRIPR|nr:hypothetical protein L195_g039196 [Trifolium pratense]